MHFCQKRFTVTLPHRGELEGEDLSKWVTFPTASPVVNLMGSLSPHSHCCDSPVTNYHHKPINTIAMEECQHVKTTEAAESWSTKSVKHLKTNTLMFCSNSESPSLLSKNKSCLIFHVRACFSDRLQPNEEYNTFCLSLAFMHGLFTTLSRPSCQSHNMLSQYNNWTPGEVKPWVGEQYTNLHKEQSPEHIAALSFNNPQQ